MADSPHRYLFERPNHISVDVAKRALNLMQTQRGRGVPAVVSLRHLSIRSSTSYAFLREVVKRDVDAYELFDVRGKNGKTRTIAAPGPDLARVQRWILHTMLDRLPPHPDSWAYFPGRSAVAAAERHVGAGWLIKFDLKNFFHQIDERMVFRLFQSFGYSRLVSFEMARICTREAPLRRLNWLPEKYSIREVRKPGQMPYRTGDSLGYLPQGAPSSGALSNLIARPLDEALSKWANANGMTYSRYSDDVVFSAEPDSYSIREANRRFAAARQLIEREGWEPNPSKGRIVPPGSRLIVLGMLVDGQKVRIRHELRTRVNEHLRGIEKFGVTAHASHRHFRDAYGMLNHVRGLVEYVRSVDPLLAEKYDARLRPFES